MEMAGSTDITSQSDGSTASHVSYTVKLLKLKCVQPGYHPGGLDGPGDGAVIEQTGAQGGGQHAEMLIVALGVIPQEAELVVTQASAAGQPVGPAAGLGGAQAFDHEHRAEQVDRIRQPGAVEDEARQSGRADVLSGRAHHQRIAADGRVVMLE